jgi:hypothetical protein
MIASMAAFLWLFEPESAFPLPAKTVSIVISQDDLSEPRILNFVEGECFPESVCRHTTRKGKMN